MQMLKKNIWIKRNNNNQESTQPHREPDALKIVQHPLYR